MTLPRLMLMQFAVLYGDDWFLVPLELHLGSLTRVTDIEVRDVFGHTETLGRSCTDGSSPRERWEMFALTREEDIRGVGAGDFLYLPPVAGYRDESLPLEEVRFIRDEGANMVWGLGTTTTARSP